MNSNIHKTKEILKQCNNMLSNNINFNNNLNQSGKIMEKFIIIKNEHTIPKENKIKEFEIVIKNTKSNENYLRRQKSDNIFKIKNIPNLKKTIYNEPYLKPTFQIKNKNYFSIKKSRRKNDINYFNDDKKNIYLNFFKIYYDENGKKIKIIKNKCNYKENKSKELVLTQSNKELNNEWMNKRNYNKLKKNNTSDFYIITNNLKINNNKDNRIGIKYFNLDTPSQSTTTENKSNDKSVRNINKEEIIRNTNTIKYLNKKKIKKNNKLIENNNNNIYYDNLPQFLKKRKNQKNFEKRFKKEINDKKIALNNKNLLLNNNEKFIILEKSLNKLKKINSDVSKDLLISRFNNNKEINLSNSKNNNLENENIKSQKINYFHNNISNVTLNMTFEQNNLSNTINHKVPNLKSINVSSSKKRNKKNEIQNSNSFCLNNNLSNIIKNKKNKLRNNEIHCNYILFNFLKENNIRNKSLGYQNLRNTIDSHESSIKEESNLSFNILKNNFSNTYNEKQNEINILNKTKEILKIKDNDLKILSEKKPKQTLLANSHTLFNSNQILFFKTKNISLENKYFNNINEKIANIPNLDYNINSKTMIDSINPQNHTLTNISQFNKRPCSLYINKRLIGKTRIVKKVTNNNNNHLNLEDYYNEAIDKDSHLNMNIKNNYLNIKSKKPIKQNTKKDKNLQKEDINNNDDSYEYENIKKNLYAQKFINLNQNCSSHQLINKRIKMDIFKFNRNKCFLELSSNNSLNFIPPFIKINKTINHEYGLY